MFDAVFFHCKLANTPSAKVTQIDWFIEHKSDVRDNLVSVKAPKSVK